MERLIVLDTETTGFDPKEGHRIVEIGCVELVNMRKGDERQWFINPERDIPEEATKVHGITNEQVADCPIFKKIAKEFMDFIGKDQLVIHNAEFDMRFLNAELKRIHKSQGIPMERAIDTIPMARRKFPGQTVNLDALCKRLGVDNSGRTFHGALLDSHLLAEVYIELKGGNQFNLDLAASEGGNQGATQAETEQATQISMNKRSWSISPETLSDHEAYLAMLDKESGDCIWLKK
uniref:DNA polymerase III subunit epsilon n=1 Tax=Magnetococcus massalia (strain MO-1) TaxID=451514 RepID=A0A1S7LL58_MAGMO|nr:DNA polymerase III subunit epsilon [Candidatus Magnetococcus massalia]